MYQNKIKLCPEDILKKEFRIDTRGYRLKEVDQYLDTIIGDYEQFFDIISGLEKEKAELLAENVNLKQELRNLNLNMEVIRNSDQTDVSNVDVLRRLSQLEKLVYNSTTKKDNNENDDN